MHHWGKFMTVDQRGDSDRSRSLRPLIGRSFLGMGAIFLFAALVGLAVGDRLANFAGTVIETLGILGVGICVFTAEAFGLPVPPSTYTFAAVAGGSPVTAVLLISFATSIGGASLAYLIGPYVGRLPVIRTWLDRFYADGEVLFKKWGIWTVGIAAMTPLPFSVCCWLAGIYRMAYIPFFTATLVRIPRLLLYYGVFALGWTGGAAI